MPKIRRKSVNQAIELLQSVTGGRKHERSEAVESDVLHNINMHCNIIPSVKRRSNQQVTSFSRNLILSEIRSHVARKDWSQARNLLLSLLRHSIEIEPLIWRYIFIITLYGDTNTLSNISQFFETCIGSSHSDNTSILQNLLLLPHKH